MCLQRKGIRGALDFYKLTITTMHLRIFITVLGIMALFAPGFSQQSEPVDSLGSEEEYNSYFVVGLMYNSNSATGQTEPTLNTSATLGDISFYHKSGLWASLSPALYPNTTEITYDMDVSLGYQYFFDNGIDLNVGYQYHHFKGDSAYLGIDYDHIIDFSAGYFSNGFYGNIDYYALLGGETNSFANISLGYYFDWMWGTNDNWGLSLLPIISAGWGTDYWLYQSMSTEERATLISDIEDEGFKTELFDYQGIDIIFPVNLRYSNFSIGLSYMYSISSEKYRVIGLENQSGFLLSLDYVINLK